ncbi:MAG: RpiB/LacA/LacB family sugar-phosphate isomerase [Bdellovibrionales bacterium]
MTQKLTQKPIALAADHRGFPLKEHIKKWLQAHDYTVNDFGTDQAANRVDAMDYALKVVKEIKEGRSDFAIAICGSGQMMAMTANRFPFIRAALVHQASEATDTRQHHDANVLALPADLLDPSTTETIVQTFLTTAPLGDRYSARREKLNKLDIREI